MVYYDAATVGCSVLCHAVAIISYAMLLHYIAIHYATMLHYVMLVQVFPILFVFSQRGSKPNLSTQPHSYPPLKYTHPGDDDASDGDLHSGSLQKLVAQVHPVPEGHVVTLDLAVVLAVQSVCVGVWVEVVVVRSGMSGDGDGNSGGWMMKMGMVVVVVG